MMLKGTVSLWNSLWVSHRETKKFLLMSFGKTGDNGKSRFNNSSAVGSGIGGPGDPVPEDSENRKAYTRPQLIGLFLGPLLFVLTLLFFQPEGLSPEGKAVLASTLWIATWWITEAIPIPATSLLPIILLPITGAVEGNTVVSSYGNDIIFLFLGGFFIALAMEKWDLHKRMALAIISWIGTSTRMIILGFMFATGFLSMWVSNTAAVMMMVPIGLAIAFQVQETLQGEQKEELPKFEKALLFGIGYSGSIGGLGTLIGTPPNIILAGTVQELFGVEISFAGWMLFAVPLVLFLLLSVWLYLTRIAFPIQFKHIPGGREMIQREKSLLGMMSYEEKAVMTVFVFTAFMWITRTFIWQDIVGVPGISDGMIAMIATLLLFLIPAKQSDATKILEWNDSKEIPWGILLLFGGGLAIASGFSETGLSTWIGEQLTVLGGLHFIIIVLAATTVVIFLTEITSNTATGTMILPVVASLALALQIHPYALMVPAALAASCAFMLPVGTPPNAIIFGTEKLKMIEMVKVGFWLNIFAVILIVLFVYTYLPIVWNIDLLNVPSFAQ